jgi:hypothetical protein
MLLVDNTGINAVSNKMDPLAKYKVSGVGPTETSVSDKLPY